MKTKIGTVALAALLTLGVSVVGGEALGLGGPGDGPGAGTMCVAMCSAEQYERDMATMQELYAMFEACGIDDKCREAAGAWAEAQFEESRRLWEECDKSCEGY